MNKLRIIKENLNKKGRIIDIGCGPCWSTEFFDDVIGVDSAFGLLDGSKSVVQGKAETLPFKSDSFDVILCVTAVHHFGEEVFAEMKRVAKHDAVIVISVLKKANDTRLTLHFKPDKVIDEGKDMIYFCKDVASNEIHRKA